MARLTQELRQEHIHLQQLLNEAKRLGIETKEGRDLLEQARALLQRHLAKEDEVLYPALRDAGTHDRRLAALLQLYARDLSDVSETAASFFEKYGEGGQGFQFNRDFGVMLARLGLRIGNEERDLYEEFERVGLPENPEATHG